MVDEKTKFGCICNRGLPLLTTIHHAPGACGNFIEALTQILKLNVPAPVDITSSGSCHNWINCEHKLDLSKYDMSQMWDTKADAPYKFRQVAADPAIFNPLGFYTYSNHLSDISVVVENIPAAKVMIITNTEEDVSRIAWNLLNKFVVENLNNNNQESLNTISVMADRYINAGINFIKLCNLTDKSEFMKYVLFIRQELQLNNRLKFSQELYTSYQDVCSIPFTEIYQDRDKVISRICEFHNCGKNQQAVEFYDQYLSSQPTYPYA